MSSPAGAEVGRVTIRVLPDLDRFRETIEAAARSIDDVKIQVDADMTKFNDRVREARAAAEANAVEIPVNFKIDDRLRNDVAAASAGIEANVQVNWVPPLAVLRAQLALLVFRAQAGLSANIPVRFNNGAGLSDEFFTALARMLAGANRDSQGLAGNLNNAADGAENLGRGARLAVIGFAALLALAGPLIIAGAAIAAAWGAISVAVAALAPAILGLAGIVATGFLGFDGIKKGFEDLAKPLEKLKERISDVFEKELQKAVPALRFILSELDTYIEDVAESLSFVVRYLATFFENARQLDTIKAVFENLATTITLMAPPIAKIIDALANVAAVSTAWDVFLKPLTTFADEFNASSIRLTADSEIMSVAFTGLANVLAALAKGFVYLVENGIRLFSTAAPGVTQFLDSLTSFFNRFDWEALGVSVGNVFGGLAETLDAVPQETIDAITVAFQELGVVFKDKAIQQAWVDIIGILPQLISGLGSATKAFAGIAQSALGAAQVVSGAVDAVQAGLDRLSGKITPEEHQKRFDAAMVKIKEGYAKFGDGIDILEGEFQQRIDGSLVDITGNVLDASGQAVGVKMESLRTGTAAGFRAAEETAKVGATNLNTALKPPPGPGPELEWGFTAENIGPRVGEALVAAANWIIPGAGDLVKSLLPPSDPVPPWVSIPGQIQGGIMAGTPGVNAAGVALGVAGVRGLDTGLAPAGATADAQLAPVATAPDRVMPSFVASLGAGMQGGVDTVRTGATNIGTEAGQVEPNINTNTSGLNAQLLVAAGRATMEGLLAGVKAAAEAVYTYVAGIAARIAALKGPLSYDKRLLIPAGKAIMSGLGAGLRTGYATNVASFVSSVAPQIADSVGMMDTSFADTMSSSFNPNNTFSPDLTATYSAAVQGEGVGEQIARAMANWQVVIDGDGMAKMVNKSNTRRGAR